MAPNPDPISPAQLKHQLQRLGLEVLGVSMDQREGFLIVYLHGPAGQWVNGGARHIIESVHGVIAATNSVLTPAIVLARTRPRPELPGSRKAGDSASPGAEGPAFREHSELQGHFASDSGSGGGAGRLVAR